MLCTGSTNAMVIFKCILTFTTFWANSADNILMNFFLFFQKTGFDISCKLSPMETICMKCQILIFLGGFFEKKKKIFQNVAYYKVYPAC